LTLFFPELLISRLGEFASLAGFVAVVCVVPRGV